MKKIFLFLLLCCTILSLNAQKRVVELPAVPNEKGILPQTEGFAYFLPQTSFRVEVTVVKNNFVKGYYADYAEKLLGLSNVITSNKTSYKLKNVKISTFETIDSTHTYWVELSNKQLKNNYLQEIYAQRNTLQTLPYDSAYAPTTMQLPDFFKNYSELTYIEKEDTYVERKIVDSVVTEIAVNQIKKVEKSVEQKAKEAADFIIKIRNDRYALISGEQEVAYSQDALAFLTQELNQSEKNYLELFTGVTTEAELHYVIVVTPTAKDSKWPLFSFSTENGLNTKMDEKKQENNYFLQLIPQISQKKVSQFMSEKAKEEKYAAAEGYKIRIPVPAAALLLQNKNILSHFGLFSVAQFGDIRTLPAASDDFDITKFAIVY